jgi:16S rRNA (cytosine967-C5)-methyltransferase
VAGKAPSAAGRGSRPSGRTRSRAAQSGSQHGQRNQRRGRADPARRAACDVLCAVAERDAYANLLLPATLTERGLTGRDAALATELTYGTLRGQGTYDAVLAVCSDRELASLEPAVREILRLGTHQLLSTRIAPHAAVATSVDLVRDVVGPRPAGFVNAVLRRVAGRDLEAWLEIAAPDRAADPEGHLAVRYSHPRWIVSALREALGGSLAETEAALAADGERPAVTLCAVPGQAGPAEFEAAGATPARWSPYGAYLSQGDPAEIPAIAQGRAGVQDEASQLAAIALSRVPVDSRAGDQLGDQRWLDLCAGPGGKTALLAALGVQAGARVTAVEPTPARADLVVANTRGLPVDVLRIDGRHSDLEPTFDRVLVDAPCTGLGALRRRPEARWRRQPADVPALAKLQRELLAAAIALTRPGGVVLYATCSPHLAETVGVVADALRRHPVQALDARPLFEAVDGLRDGPYVQLWPHRHGTDAMFAAALRREAG